MGEPPQMTKHESKRLEAFNAAFAAAWRAAHGDARYPDFTRADQQKTRAAVGTAHSRKGYDNDVLRRNARSVQA
jgi:hypothetical protein